ncbi:TPA: hypothetical protein ACH9PH_005521, partial [Escherichia coli]
YLSPNGVKASTVTKVVMVATDTPNLGITSKPQNLGVTLTTQTTGSFRSFMVELQICNSPTSQRNFALSGISASYRADFLKLRFPKESIT